MNKGIQMSTGATGFGLIAFLYSQVSLPLSFETITKFMKRKGDFVLYLRGFDSDDYTPSFENTAEKIERSTPWRKYNANKEIDPKLLPLKEANLFKAWNKYFKVVSVGRPDELECPEGSKRIYLDNETWQEDALTLMEYAEYILVCVNPKPNCIWEIDQCNKYYAYKTIYYIDCVSKLDALREKMGKELPECLNSCNLTQDHMFAYTINGKIHVGVYDNNLKLIANEVKKIVSQE